MKGPLTGVKVVELGSAVAGPLCGALLGDMGADVVKLEPPGRGDDARRWGNQVKGESPYFLQYNRNKRSITLDIRTRKGRAVLLKLLRKSDVLVENFRPGTLKRLSLSYATVSKVNPRLVYCSVSGFGQTGPYSGRGGYDSIVQALCGLMSITGEEEGAPMRVGVPITDILAALYASFSVALALLHRRKTGRGEHIDVSLYESGVSAVAQWLSISRLTGERTRRFGNRYPLLAPYELFETADRPMVVAVGNDEIWTRLCRLLGKEELISDPHFRTNPDRIKPENRRVLTRILQNAFKARAAAEWERVLSRDGIPVGVISGIEDLLNEPQLATRKAFATMSHSVLGNVTVFLGLPKFSTFTPSVRRPTPTLGEHTDEVLSELGYSKRQILEMRRDKVL